LVLAGCPFSLNDTRSSGPADPAFCNDTPRCPNVSCGAENSWHRGSTRSCIEDDLCSDTCAGWSCEASGDVPCAWGTHCDDSIQDLGSFGTPCVANAGIDAGIDANGDSNADSDGDGDSNGDAPLDADAADGESG
jgi:hypothetical protein